MTDDNARKRVSRTAAGHSSATPTGPGSTRQPKRSREQLRVVMLQAAQEILLDEGLGVGTDALTFRRVFDRVEADTGLRLTNASIIRRVWENQTEYHTEVLLAIAADAGDEGLAAVTQAIAPVLAALDTSSPARRVAAAREICRVGGNAEITTLDGSAAWSLWIGVWALATAGEVTEQKRRIRQALSASYRSGNDQYLNTYLALSTLLGLRLRPGLTIHQFTVAVGALAEGCALRNRVDEDQAGFLLPTGPGGEAQEWTLFSLGLQALAARFFEIDPEFEPADLVAS
jgi:hypothetical protein